MGSSLKKNMDHKLTLSVSCLPKLPKALSKPQCHGTKGKLWYHEFTHNNCMPVHFDVICSICFWCVGFTIVFLCVQKSRDLVKFAGVLREKNMWFLVLERNCSAAQNAKKHMRFHI